MFTYLWNVIYEYPVVKSVGLNLCSLLDSSSSSSVDARSFGGVVILSLSLKLNFVISSLIVGTFKSARKSLLDIYRGEFTIARRTLFWYLCNISMFELLAVPQRGIPYVQMSFRMVCTWVTYFIFIAPIFFLASNTYVGISTPAVFFWRIPDMISIWIGWQRALACWWVTKPRNPSVKFADILYIKARELKFCRYSAHKLRYFYSYVHARTTAVIVGNNTSLWSSQEVPSLWPA